MDAVTLHMPPERAKALREAHAIAGQTRPDGSIELKGFVILSVQAFDRMAEAYGDHLAHTFENSVAGQKRQGRGGDNHPLRPDAVPAPEHDPDT